MVARARAPGRIMGHGRVAHQNSDTMRAVSGMTKRIPLTVASAAVASLSPRAALAAAAPVAAKPLFRGPGGACLSCHSLELRGGGSASDLSWIGMLRTADSLRRALTDPSVHAPKFSPVE